MEVVNTLLDKAGVDAPRKRRFAEPLDWAVLLSVLLHVLILSIQFGLAGSGKPLPPSSTPPLPIAQADIPAPPPVPSSPDVATSTNAHLPPGEFVVTLAPRKPAVQPAPTPGSAVLPPKRKRTGVPVMTAAKGKWHVATQGRARKQPPPVVANADIGTRNVDTPLDAPNAVDEADRPVVATADMAAKDGAPAPAKAAPEAAQEKPQAPQPSPEDLALAQQKHEAELAAAAEEKHKAEAQKAAEKARVEAEALAKQQAEEVAKAKLAAIAAAEQAKAQAVAEAVHKAELERAAEEQRKADEAKKAEDARKQAALQLAEAQRQADEQRKVEEQQRAETQRKQEAQRQADEQARQEAARKQEEQRKQELTRQEAERQAEAQRKAEELRRIDAQRVAAEQAGAAKGADRSTNTTGQGSGPGVGNGVGAGKGAGAPDRLGLRVPIESPPQLSLAQRALQQLHELPPDNQPAPNRGRRGQINSNTPPADDLAFYGDGWSVKVARIAALNPLRPTGHSSDHLVIGVVINSDGSLKDVYILRSSGDHAIDEKARHIVAMSAPFSPFAERMRSRFDEVEITRTWIFADGVSRLTY